MALALGATPMMFTPTMAVVLSTMLILVLAPMMMTVTIASPIVMMFVLVSVLSTFICPPTFFVVLFTLFLVPAATPNKYHVDQTALSFKSSSPSSLNCPWSITFAFALMAPIAVA